MFNGDCSCLSLLCIYSLWAFFLKINDFLDFFVSLQAGPRPGTDLFFIINFKSKITARAIFGSPGLPSRCRPKAKGVLFCPLRGIHSGLEPVPCGEGLDCCDLGVEKRSLGPGPAPHSPRPHSGVPGPLCPADVGTGIT